MPPDNPQVFPWWYVQCQSMTMQAGLATMHQLTPGVYERLNDNGTLCGTSSMRWPGATMCLYASRAWRHSLVSTVQTDL